MTAINKEKKEPGNDQPILNSADRKLKVVSLERGFFHKTFVRTKTRKTPDQLTLAIDESDDDSINQRPQSFNADNPIQKVNQATNTDNPIQTTNTDNLKQAEQATNTDNAIQAEQATNTDNTVQAEQASNTDFREDNTVCPICMESFQNVKFIFETIN